MLHNQKTRPPSSGCRGRSRRWEWWELSGQSPEEEEDDGDWGDWVVKVVLMVKENPDPCQGGSELSSTIMVNHVMNLGILKDKFWKTWFTCIIAKPGPTLTELGLVGSIITFK